MAEETELRHIVRIAGKDLKGELPLALALTHVKGVGNALANAIAKQASRELKVDEQTKLGMLDEKQTEAIEKIILEPSKHGIPEWMLNRRKEPLKGADTHLTGHDLDFAVKGDLDKEKKMRSYRGVRHSQGLTVRGQRTKTSGRKGQTVGVKRRKGTKGSGK